MSYNRDGYNPYSNPYSSNGNESNTTPESDFVATSYDQFSQPAAPTPAATSQIQQQATVQPQAYANDEQTNFAFFGEVDDIKRHLVQYEDNIERIESLHKRSLAESNVENESAIQRQIDTLHTETRGLAETLRARIKKLESTSQRDPTKHVQTQNLKRQFMSMIQKFQASEAAFQQRYQEVLKRQYRIVDPNATDEQVQAAIEDEQGGQVFSQALMQSNRRGEARAALSEVQSRHREIQKIEQTLTELAQLFQDMEVMVAEQDVQVTNIEQNTYSAENDIEKGLDNQYGAIKKARAWRKKKWCCFILIAVVVLFCILFFAIYFGGGYNK